MRPEAAPLSAGRRGAGRGLPAASGLRPAQRAAGGRRRAHVRQPAERRGRLAPATRPPGDGLPAARRLVLWRRLPGGSAVRHPSRGARVAAKSGLPGEPGYAGGRDTGRDRRRSAGRGRTAGRSSTTTSTAWSSSSTTGACRPRLGAVGRDPRWAVAYKFAPTTAQTRLRKIHINVGRTGVLNPWAELDPVEVGGVTVEKATLHNEEDIRRKDLREGDVVVDPAGRRCHPPGGGAADRSADRGGAALPMPAAVPLVRYRRWCGRPERWPCAAPTRTVPRSGRRPSSTS